ncbi:hypothetical protein FBU30_006931 [Linnemannia zychae]|nr:hypothetical protein FBU30_006931 [Linnemannia zychae]
MDPIFLPTRQSIITLQDITSDNWTHIIRLVVNIDQLTLCPPTVESLCGHQFHLPFSIVKAIYADSIPVGYLRVQQLPEIKQGLQGVPAAAAASAKQTLALSKTYQIECFMIDQACQGLGFGTKALALLQKELGTRSSPSTTAAIDNKINECSFTLKVSTASFSTVPADDSPEHFFSGSGFTIDIEHKEMVWVSHI